MNFQTENDRTDYNRLADQFATRLREQLEASVAEPVAAPKKTTRRAARAETPEPVVTPIAPQAPQERPAMSAIQIFNCEQNTPEWHLARMGIPTASSFADVLTKGRDGKSDGLTRRTYLHKLAGEILTGQPMEMVRTFDMERGHAMEPEARDLYVLETGAVLEKVGFVRRGRVGCSPDSLIGKDGGLEIKTKAPHLLIDTILKDEFPAEHKAQVQGTLWITDREWWDLECYWPGMPKFIKRAYRDEAYIATLASEIERFNNDLDAIVEQMKVRMDIKDEFAAAA